jgi:hypothetical protein
MGSIGGMLDAGVRTSAALSFFSVLKHANGVMQHLSRDQIINYRYNKTTRDRAFARQCRAINMIHSILRRIIRPLQSQQ